MSFKVPPPPPIMETIARKLSGIGQCPHIEQQRMIDRAAKAAWEIHEAEIEKIKTEWGCDQAVRMANKIVLTNRINKLRDAINRRIEGELYTKVNGELKNILSQSIIDDDGVANE